MATVGINLKCNNWKNIRDFWTLQAALEEKDDASEEEDVSSEEEEDFSEEEVESSENVSPKSPDKDAEGENN